MKKMLKEELLKIKYDLLNNKSCNNVTENTIMLFNQIKEGLKQNLISTSDVVCYRFQYSKYGYVKHCIFDTTSYIINKINNNFDNNLLKILCESEDINFCISEDVFTFTVNLKENILTRVNK